MPTRTGLIRLGALVIATALAVTATALVAWRFAAGPAGPVRAAFPQVPAPDIWQGLAWSEVDLAAFSEPGSIGSAATDGSTIVAAGDIQITPKGPLDPRDGGRPQPVSVPVLWQSADGGAWTRTAIVVEGRPVAATQVALSPAGIAGVAYPEGGRPMVVASRDGVTWHAIAIPRGVELNQLLPTADGFVAIGYRAERAVVWQVSGNGAAAPADLPPAEKKGEVLDATVAPDRLVLVGRAIDARGTTGMIWMSGPEGWKLTGPKHPVFDRPQGGTTVTGIVAFAGGLFATGFTGDMVQCFGGAGGSLLTAGPIFADHGEGPAECAATWVSTDGETWRRAGQPDGVAVGGGLGQVVAGGEGLLTMVNEAGFDERNRIGLWTSADGIEWRRIGDVPADANGTLLTLLGRVLVVGSAADGVHPAVWIGEPVR